MKKVLVLGSNGMLGQNFLKRFYKDYEVTGVSLEKENLSKIQDMQYFSLDLTERKEIQTIINKVSPDIIINCAAFTDVDGCEDIKAECWEVNVHILENIFECNFNKKPILVHISTDYIFDGRDGSYRENDLPNPQGEYARSKMAAENIIKAAELEYIIIRTQVLYGHGKQVRLNFATWVIDQLKKENKIKVVDDQIGCPTYALDAAEAVFRLLENKAYGIYHVSGAEKISRYDFALKIADIFQLDSSFIERARTEELKQKSPRPMDSSFILDKLVNYTGWEPHDVKSGLQLLRQEIYNK